MTALVTPMRNGRVDREALSALVEWQISAGVHALVAVGTTGESATLSPEEQAEVVECVVTAAQGRVPVVAGAGANATAHAVALSRRAARAGADALLHVTPYYNKPTQEGLYQHFAACAAATDLGIILYNVPGRTGTDLLPDTVVRLAELPQVIGIKDATGDMRRAAELVYRLRDRTTVLSGDDFTAFPFFCLGGGGMISVVSNVVPTQTAAMWEATNTGQIAQARELHLELFPLLELLFCEPNPIPTKAALQLMGRIGPELRAPLTPCSPGLRARLEQCLREKDLL
jgi:4-hydroxy-tetrahydrodipicolinate synthase